MDVRRETHPSQGHDFIIVLKYATRPCVKGKVTLEKCDFQRLDNLMIMYTFVYKTTHWVQNTTSVI